MKKGQTVLEFLFLLLIIIIYLTTLVIPLTKDAQNAIGDTEKIARANNETQKIANSIEKVSMLGEGSRQTIDVFVPENTKILCTSAGLKFEVILTLIPFPAQCDVNGKCTKLFPFPQNTIVICPTNPLSAYTKASITAEKTSAGVTLTQTS
ncbi:MAG: hypothetical protein WCI04_05875 [archaeon]